MVDDSAWTEEVKVDGSEIVKEVRVSAEPECGVMARMHDPLGMPVERVRGTAAGMLMLTPEDQIRIVLRDNDETDIASFGATVEASMDCTSTTDIVVLVGDFMTMRISIVTSDGRVNFAGISGQKISDSTNEGLLEFTNFCLCSQRAASMVFEVKGKELLSLEPFRLPTGKLREFEVLAETTENIVAIEQLVGQTVQSFKGSISSNDRILLRIIRLLLEGNIVHALRRKVRVTALEGGPPRKVATPAGNLNIGGILVPVPLIYMRHPAMKVTKVDALSASSSDSKIFRVEAPGGQRLMAWAPDLVNISGDEDLVVTRPWNLIGIDEESYDD